jgi:nucleoside-diphosphate-sugar epimerase
MSMNCIAITGASGYIGQNLVAGLLDRGGYRVKLLSRTKDSEHSHRGAVETVDGDLLLPKSLSGFLEPGCTVINLVYLWDAGEAANLAAMGNLVAACKAAGVKRLIHVSTAAVVGRVNECLITETTPCRPVSEYGVTKLNVESLIRREGGDSFDLAILRPTSVFGPGGEPLGKLADALENGHRLRNYLKSCLFNGRRMNLVHIANVVEAVIFLANRPENLAGEIFIVSDDDSDANNFSDVESALMRGLGVSDYRLPRVPVPLGVLRLLLSILGRNNVNPGCNYSGEKLLRLGFRRAVSFEAGLSDYISAYQSARSSQAVPDART